MKNLFKLFTLCVTVVLFQSCEEDLVVYSGDAFVQLSSSSSASLVENGGESVTITALLSEPQSSAVTVNFDVSGSAAASRYTLSPGASLSIPAGETSASLTVTPVDNDDIDGDVDIVLTLSSSSGLPVGVAGEGLFNTSRTVTIVDDNVPCNDLNVQIITDAWGCETSWEITDSTGAVVASEGPLTPCGSGSDTFNTAVTLEDGCYTFTIFDSYGDGQASGSYLVTCGNIVHASGSGQLDTVPGFEESTDFCVNQ
ncbi:hypothetical protein [Winogradskyella sp. A3E31]|uniref:hypothetical protein n=1 Tax=Winogradskyella sp. A3E31 TaxID=3349637 RepID=UPI00398B3A87